MPATDARAEIFGLVFLVAQGLSRLADRELERHGLTTSQWLLLAVLARGFPGRAPTLSEAAALYGTSRQNVKQVARQLEARGFIELAPDPADARALTLRLTPRVSVFDRARERRRQQRFLEETSAGLDAKQARQLERLLRAWLATITKRSR